MPQINDLGVMEVRFGLHSGLSKTQIELLNAARALEIKTFGWPFAVMLENREEYKPRPLGDGIRAEISMKDRNSYDYWAARKNGDFFALQGYLRTSGMWLVLQHPHRARDRSAHVRRQFLHHLGAAPDARLSVRVTHRGLAGRPLKSIGNSVMFDARTSHAEVSETEMVVVLGDIQAKLVDEVRRICEPMFMLFDFQAFTHDIYENIVRRFEAGETS